MGKEKRLITIDADLLEGITKKLLQIEAWAAGLQEECCKTRMLIEKEEGVSTPAKNQPLSEAQLAARSAQRRMRIYKKGLKKA